MNNIKFGCAINSNTTLKTIPSREKHDPTFDMAKGGGKRVQPQAKQESMQLNNKFQVLES